MKIKQTMRNVTTAAAMLVLVSLPAISFFSATPVEAACGSVETSIINCGQNNTDQDGSGKVEVQETGVWAIIILIINILISGVAVLALAGIVYGAVLYTSAGSNAEQVKKAIGIFTNVAIGVAAFAGMWVLLNFLIPGGAFTNL